VRKTARKEKRERRNGARIDPNGQRDRASTVRGLHQPKTELESAVQRFIDLYDFAPIAYVSFDRTGQIEEANLVATQLLREPRDLLIGRPFALYVADLDLLLKHLLLCRTSDQEVKTELLLKNKKGEQIPALLLSTPVTSTIRNGAKLYQTAIIDLRELKAAEAKLRTSEQRYRDLFDLVPVAVYTCDADGFIREYNKRAVELWGRAPGPNGEKSRFCGSHKIYYPDGRPMRLEQCPLARAVRGEKLTANDLEIVVERPDGEKRNVIPAPRVVTDEGGKIVGAINCLFDVTERKRAEAVVRRLAAIVQSSHDAIVAKDLNGIITDWNHGAERMFGYKPKEIVGKSVLTLIPKDRQSEEEEILRKVRRGESLDHYETVRRRKNGELFEVSLTISPMKGPKGEIVGVSKIARDITKRKKAERRVAEQARLLDLSNDAILVRDTQDRIVYWSRGAEEMYGWSAKEAVGKVTHELFQTAHPESLTSIRRRLERDNHWAGELIHTRKDGEIIVVFSRWRVDQDVRGRRAPILETNTDITARKRAEQQQRALYRFAQLQHAAISIDKVYEAALDAIVSAFSCHRASILLFDKNKVMRFVASRGLSEGYRKAVEGHSPWKPHVKRPKPVCFNNIADIPKALKSTIRGEGIRAAAFIPLISNQKLIGKFMTYYDAPHVFTDEEMELAVTIATQLTQVIEHKHDEQALQQKEAELEQIVTQTPFMLTRCTRDLRYRYVSRAYAEMFGRTPEDMAGKAIVEVIGRKALNAISPCIQKVLNGKQTRYEMEVPFRGTGPHWIDCVYIPDRDSDGNVVGWFASLIDIGQRKKTEAMLQKSKELLEKRVRERTCELDLANRELVAEIQRRKGLEGEILSVSDREQQRLGQELHDGLCQHLTAVAFMARSIALRLRDHRVVDAADIEKIADLVNKAAVDTRNLSRALHRVDVDAAGLVTALQDLVDREIWRTPCRLEVQRSFQINNDVAAAHLYRIAREAVINANKHAQARHIIVRLERSRHETVLQVIDDGIGFPKDSKFRQGLGYHIMKYRTQLMGGRLEIDSPQEGGTRLSCYVPIHTSRSRKAKNGDKPGGAMPNLSRVPVAGDRILQHLARQGTANAIKED
jgi:PAS domain S-box-containing protein